jgi:hypothetical protein
MSQTQQTEPSDRQADDADDSDRDLAADLDILERLPPPPWKWWSIGESGGSQHHSLVFWNGPGGRGPCSNGNAMGLAAHDAPWLSKCAFLYARELNTLRADVGDMLAEAREGWPIAIRRAIAAERETERLRTELIRMRRLTRLRCGRCEAAVVRLRSLLRDVRRRPLPAPPLPKE